MSYDPKNHTGELSADRQKLVADNIGLVAVHLRRHVPGGRLSRRDREYDDLFQEGCLGLIQAARTYDPDRGIPFASFALARIRQAVSRALDDRFSLVRLPPARTPRKPRTMKKRQETSPTMSAPRSAEMSGRPMRIRQRPVGPRIVELDAETATRAADPRQSPLDPSTDELYARLRDRRRLASQRAVEHLLATGRQGSHQAMLLQRLRDERYLILREEYRTPLRQLAREMGVSVARATRLERRLNEQARALMRADPQVAVLLAGAIESKADEDMIDSPRRGGPPLPTDTDRMAQQVRTVTMRSRPASISMSMDASLQTR